MKIYIDYDDCLCETARAFTGIAERLFGKKVPYEEVQFFNLQDSFKLTDDEYKQLCLNKYDRPWNRECKLLNSNYFRCPDWEYIRGKVI